MIYIVLVDLFAKDFEGIRKKIFAQMAVFEKHFGCIYYTSYSGQVMYLISNGKIIEKELAFTKQECNNWALKWMRKYAIQKAYIRYAVSDKWFIGFVKELKEKNVITILEFPTIPYDEEISNNRVRTEDQYYREQLSDYIEQCTTYANYDSVFGIPCISLMNGVDLEQHPVHNIRKPDGKIILVAVAAMGMWHGYERVIEGMAAYYADNGTENIIFRLVGEGPESNKYRQLVKKYNLEKHVEFLGYLEGEALNRQYDEADIAIGTLAFYKIKVIQASPIKVREYCARGIPFIYGYEDIGFSGKEKYLLKVPNDNSLLDMNEVLSFYNRAKKYNFYTEDMRKYTVETCTWDSILNPVIDYYNKKNK